MRSVGDKLILRFLNEDLEATKKAGSLYLDTSFNPNEHVCQVAVIEATNDKMEKEQLLFQGDKVLVQYLVGLDTFDEEKNVQRNMFFLEREDNGDEIRWCHISNLFGKQSKKGFMPLKNYIFCNLVPNIKEHYEGGIFVPEQKVDTETKGYETTIKYIHPHDAKEMNLKSGDRIMCSKNSDAVKKVFGELLLRVREDCVLGKLN